MRKKQSAQHETAPRQGDQPQTSCYCMGLGPKLTDMLMRRSEGAAGHLRNARIELLKAMRVLIDDRIEHLARAQKKKGTTVSVE